MMYLLYQLDGDLPGYPRKQFEDDIVNECEKDIRSCFAAGAAHVVMDFTEGRLAPRNDPRNPWTTRNLLPFFIELDNGVLDRFSAVERKNIGVHVCPGGDVDSVHSADVPYEELLKQLFKLNAGYFQLQMASERDREAAYKLVGKHLREDANGLSQMAYVGVIVTQSPRPESAQEVCDQLVAAAKHIDKQRLGSTDDCGFSPFSIDMKPNHGTPDYARDVAFQKITNRVAGTKMAAEKLGVH
jgi:methionine synthase II (cobalamin-independent)